LRWPSPIVGQIGLEFLIFGKNTEKKPSNSLAKDLVIFQLGKNLPSACKDTHTYLTWHWHFSHVKLGEKVKKEINNTCKCIREKE
jgi:hypothetical protein